jgi:hypothetical protein
MGEQTELGEWAGLEREPTNKRQNREKEKETNEKCCTVRASPGEWLPRGCVSGNETFGSGART